MVTMVMKTVAARFGAALALAGALLLAGAQQAQAQRLFIPTDITVDLAKNSFKATVWAPNASGALTEYPLDDPQKVEDGAFARLDLKVVIRDQDSVEKIQKNIEQSITSEPSGCEPGSYGPLDMVDGMRYTFTLDQTSSGQINAAIYTGERSLVWTNEIFCEYLKVGGENVTVFRVTGFFYVIHRKLDDGVDIQVRPVVLTPNEIESINFKQKFTPTK